MRGDRWAPAPYTMRDGRGRAVVFAPLTVEDLAAFAEALKWHAARLFRLAKRGGRDAEAYRRGEAAMNAATTRVREWWRMLEEAK